MKKRSFVLLEILIALSLVILCIVPLVKQPLQLYKNQMHHLEKMELERLANWTFVEIKEALYQNAIAWDDLPAKNITTEPFPLPAATIELPGCKPKTVKRSFFLKGRGEGPGSGNSQIRQLGVYITLNENRYEFRTPAQR